MEILSSRSTAPLAAALYSVIRTGNLLRLAARKLWSASIANFSPVEGSKTTTP